MLDLMSARAQCIFLPEWGDPTDSVLSSPRGVILALDGYSALCDDMACVTYVICMIVPSAKHVVPYVRVSPLYRFRSKEWCVGVLCA